jgi:hypothetical protein
MNRRGFMGVLTGLAGLLTLSRSSAPLAGPAGSLGPQCLPGSLEPLPFKEPSPELFHLLEEIKKLSA